mmetsp:Transcript_13787/g.33045  ORF Transcript_13787/g.33045 Transcript_13787/m.33045 type:complete len:273 (-) Transcript_13787:46-864(-)
MPAPPNAYRNHGSLAMKCEMSGGGGAMSPGLSGGGGADVSKALGPSVWTPQQGVDHQAAARRVETAKVSAGVHARDAVIARREASARGRKLSDREARLKAVEEERIRAQGPSGPVDHGAAMEARLAKLRERKDENARSNFLVSLRERERAEANREKAQVVRVLRSDIKMMEDIRTKQTARLRMIEKARLEELELNRKVGFVIKMQRMFRHYMPIRIMRLKRALELNAAKKGVAVTKKLHQTMGRPVKLTRTQESQMAAQMAAQMALASGDSD